MQEKIIILDFGSQYTQLIARRLRELNTYCEILPYNKFPYGEEGIKGVILSGSPYSVNDPNALFVDLSRIRGVYPVLGVCYGAQFLAHTSGGKVESADTWNMVVPIWLGMMRTIPSCAVCGRIPPYGCRMAILLR